LREFVRYGPIASVKIMWPRSTEEQARGHMCGFVSYMKRTDASEAINQMNGTCTHKPAHDHTTPSETQFTHCPPPAHRCLCLCRVL